jgi:hypothetical protein
MRTSSRRSIRHAPAGLVAIASLVIACDAMGAQSAAQPAAQETVTAVLKMRESDFVYRTTRNPLSCDELRNSVAVILSALGARDDVQVRLTNCMGGGVPDLTVNDGSSQTWDNNAWDRSTQQQSPMERMRGSTPRQNTPVHIYAMMPVVATPKIAKEMEQDKARRELVSRVTGNMNAALNDPILFAAARQQVTLSKDNIKLRPEHCELLDQMISGVFRDFDLRAVRRSLSCDPHQRSNFAPEVTVEALLPIGYVLPVAEKKEKKQEQKEPDPAPEPAEQAPQQ